MSDTPVFRRSEPPALDDITAAIVDVAVKIHIELGPGLLESVYVALLYRSLQRRGLKVERQKTVQFEFDSMLFEEGLRVDLLVENRVIVEVKSVERLGPVHSKQLLTYLRLLRLPVGLLVNFGGATLKEGLRRVVNNLDPATSTQLRVNAAMKDESLTRLPRAPCLVSLPSPPSPRGLWSVLLNRQSVSLYTCADSHAWRHARWPRRDRSRPG